MGCQSPQWLPDSPETGPENPYPRRVEEEREIGVEDLGHSRGTVVKGILHKIQRSPW